MRIRYYTAALCLTGILCLPSWSLAQELTSKSTAQVAINKGATPASLRRKLTSELQLQAMKNLLVTNFSIAMSSQIEAKLPGLIEQLGDNFQITMDPPDGEVLVGKATLTVSAADLKKMLVNNGIGAGDIAARSAKIVISIDEFIGVATTNDAQKATSVEIQYSRDGSSFSDDSVRASGKDSSASSAAQYAKSSSSASNANSVSVAGRSSSAVASRDRAQISGARSDAAAYQGVNGQAAAASSQQYAGRADSSMAASASSQFAGAASSRSASTSNSEGASARSSASSSSFSVDQKAVKQQTDKESLSIKTKMPEFDNAKPLGAGDQVLVARLGGEFQQNGLVLVAENDLRSDGTSLVPVYQIINKGLSDQYISRIKSKKINADVWATGTANYTIVGTNATGTHCNGSLSVEARFIETNEVFFSDSIAALAAGEGDQNCRAKLGVALATSLAQRLGARANEQLNAINSRGRVYQLYLYSTADLTRSDRNQLLDQLRYIAGVQMSEPNISDRNVMIQIQYAGDLKSTLDKMLDKLPWASADIRDKSDKICIGIQGAAACPAEFK